MEAMGGMEEGEWNSLNGMYSTVEEANFMAQLLGGCGNSFWSGHASGGSAEEYYYPLNLMNIKNGNNSVVNSSVSSSSINNMGGPCFPQESSSYSGVGGGHQESYYEPAEHVLSLDFCVGDAAATAAEERGDCNMEESDNNVHVFQDYSEARFESGASKTADLTSDSLSTESYKKRSRRYAGHRNNRNEKWRKTEKGAETDAENGNEEEDSSKRSNVRTLKRQISSCPANESNSSGGGIGGSGGDTSAPQSANLNGKTRAHRGAATDPQSLYATKRRERINERLKILRNLVPNGTKVDVSTMLEEAAQYVKFLQLQIKVRRKHTRSPSC